MDGGTRSTSSVGAMNPDVFITIALCAEVALVGIGGGLFVEHEWRQTLGIDADQRQLGRSESLKASTHGARFSDVADAVTLTEATLS